MVKILTRMENLKPRVVADDFEFGGLPDGVIYEDFSQMVHSMYTGLNTQMSASE